MLLLLSTPQCVVYTTNFVHNSNCFFLEKFSVKWCRIIALPLVKQKKRWKRIKCSTYCFIESSFQNVWTATFGPLAFENHRESKFEVYIFITFVLNKSVHSQGFTWNFESFSRQSSLDSLSLYEIVVKFEKVRDTATCFASIYVREL